MKKILYTAVAVMLIGQVAMAQPVSDRAVIPVAVTLNQILRLHVTNGGNVEFVFNTIAQYKNGIGNSDFYDTDVEVASSTPWEMVLGAEDATFLGTDSLTNSMALNNVGYSLVYTGVGMTCCASANDLFDPGVAAGVFALTNGLAPYTLGGPVILTSGTAQNGGDVNENSFTINWVCGTGAIGGTTPMTTVTLLDQDINPDRYVTNVLLDINAVP